MFQEPLHRGGLQRLWMGSIHTTSSLLQPGITAPGRTSKAPAPGQDAGALLHLDISTLDVFSTGFLNLRVLPGCLQAQTPALLGFSAQLI